MVINGGLQYHLNLRLIQICNPNFCCTSFFRHSGENRNFMEAPPRIPKMGRSFDSVIK